MIKILMYLRKINGNENRMKKIFRKKEKFENNMVKEWNVERGRLIEVMKDINRSFKEIWKCYCEKMSKIWK
jgi:hypothetical protein